MKKYILPILLTSLLLSACSIDWSGDKEKKIAELEKQIQDDTFQKKQECGKYKDILEKKIAEKTKEAQNWSTYYFYNEWLKEVFYSKNEKTCFALTNLMYQFKKPNWTPNEMSKYEVITDLLTGEETNYDTNSLPAYYEEIQKLKWE